MGRPAGSLNKLTKEVKEKLSLVVNDAILRQNKRLKIHKFS